MRPWPIHYPALVRHHKGGLYLALGAATHSESQKPLVVYTCVKTWRVFVQPQARFEGALRRDVPRFAWVSKA